MEMRESYDNFQLNIFSGTGPRGNVVTYTILGLAFHRSQLFSLPLPLQCRNVFINLLKTTHFENVIYGL